MEIKFYDTHFKQLETLATKALFNDWAVKAPAPVGGSYNIVDILSTVQLGTLKMILENLNKEISRHEVQDEWVTNENDQKRLKYLRFSKDLVNLAYGYRRWKLEYESDKKKRAEIEKRLHDLKESTKTPEDKIKECEKELASLNEVPSFISEI